MSEVSEYDEDELKQWNRVVVEVNTSWRRIHDYLAEKAGANALQKEDREKIANAIVSRWLFPKDGVRSTSTAELKKIYMPENVSVELLGDFESVLDRKAYDRILSITKDLIAFDLIRKLDKRIKKEAYYEPTERLLDYCVDCSTRLKEVV